jgi:hypothetical protein
VIDLWLWDGGCVLISVLYGICIKSVAFGEFCMRHEKKSLSLESVRLRLLSKALHLGVSDMNHEENRWAWRMYDQD